MPLLLHKVKIFLTPLPLFSPPPIHRLTFEYPIFSKYTATRGRPVSSPQSPPPPFLPPFLSTALANQWPFVVFSHIHRRPFLLLFPPFTLSKIVANVSLEVLLLVLPIPLFFICCPSPPLLPRDPILYVCSSSTKSPLPLFLPFRSCHK